MKKKRNWKDIRNAFVMFCVMVAMLSTASFAWFTLTDSPTVTSLQLTAATKGGLKVCETSTGDFKNAIELSETQTKLDGKPLKLVPVSPNGAGFSEPVYTGNTVTGLGPVLTADNDLKGIVAKYKYYLKADEGTVEVGIITGDPGQTGNLGLNGDVANLEGSFVRQRTVQDGDVATMNAERAIRVGLVVDNGTMIIWEPNYGTGNTGTKATNNVPAPVPKVISNVSGTITTGGSNKTSEKLFEVGTTPKEVTMYIWIEGTDEDCVNEIKTDGIEAQIQFTALKSIVTP